MWATVPVFEPPTCKLRLAARILALVVLGGTVAGCQGARGRVKEQLDATTGMSVTSDREAIIYAKTEARYSRSARDYVYLGPVETNHQGVREYYLWVGIGTTLDRGYLAPPLELPDTLYARVDGELMEFPLRPWEEVLTVTRRRAVYRAGVPIQTQLAARVTLYQLELLARATPPSIRLGTGGTTAQPFGRWDDKPPWRGFLARVGATQPVAAKSGSANR